MKNIVITGGNGQAGRYLIQELREHGYNILSVDRFEPEERLSQFYQADITDLGAVVEAFDGADAVVHLAATTARSRHTPETTLRTNVSGTFNVFHAAKILGLNRVVYASSETTLGLPFTDKEPPEFAPVDETHPLKSNSTYALSKMLGEHMAVQIHRWSGLSFAGLRFSNIIMPDRYQTFPNFWKNPDARKRNLWGYVDVRDVAQGCRKALEADIEGTEAFILAAADTAMNRPSADLLAESFPNVPLRKDLDEYETLLSIDKARTLLGYAPQHTWRNHVG